ncbi:MULTISPECIES: branched-chain amino acid ABC transporter permease [unclassified Caballeronia]|uniref:branched-chain amino acid ABC transporter permease n=1 Tax=unclassified Caballeronia TaxID=2646786 RepID=UPI0020283A39|nr:MULTISPECIES: branched-chain amino acid ABC transporter permease [unclassified Caballeronia]
MAIFIQLALNTLQAGSVYVLFALGLTLIFGVMGVVNFAHGQFFTLGALLTSVLVPSLQHALDVGVAVSFVLSSVTSIAVVLVLAFAAYQWGFRQYLRDMVGSFILSVGMLLFLEGTFLWIFGGVPRVVPNIAPGELRILGAAVELQRLIVCAVAFVVAIWLYAMLRYTRFGRAIRATAEDAGAATLQGVRYKRTLLYGFMTGSFLAAVSGCLIAPITVITPAVGNDYLVKGFITIIIGGLGSIPGAILGGLTIAFLESVVGYYLDGTVATIGMFCLVAALLLFRPRGMLGHVQH